MRKIYLWAQRTAATFLKSQRVADPRTFTPPGSAVSADWPERGQPIVWFVFWLTTVAYSHRIGFMPRQRRVEYPGAMYHVMSRGDRREDIFWTMWTGTI